MLAIIVLARNNDQPSGSVPAPNEEQKNRSLDNSRLEGTSKKSGWKVRKKTSDIMAWYTLLPQEAETWVVRIFV